MHPRWAQPPHSFCILWPALFSSWVSMMHDEVVTAPKACRLPVQAFPDSELWNLSFWGYATGIPFLKEKHLTVILGPQANTCLPLRHPTLPSERQHGQKTALLYRAAPSPAASPSTRVPQRVSSESSLPAWPQLLTHTAPLAFHSLGWSQISFFWFILDWVEKGKKKAMSRQTDLWQYSHSHTPWSI